MKNLLPRIAPIDNPKSLLSKITFWYLKKEFGKVTMPARVIYSRFPKIGLLTKKIFDIESGFKNTNEEVRLLIQCLVASINGCPFCIDISKKHAQKKSISLDKFGNLMNFEDNNLFTVKEKTILTYVKEMTENITVKNLIYEKLKTHCNDNEIIEITFVASTENYLNRLIKPLNIGSDELCSIK
jgi:AhpD family alkylhydroperoxidase